MGKILVVNNDFDAMSLLQIWLERKTYTVKYTSDGEAVPLLIKEFQPDLLLIDVLQSKVAEQVKAVEHTNAIPIILMTGYTVSNSKIKMEKFDDVIEKPFNLSLLEEKVERFLKKSA